MKVWVAKYEYIVCPHCRSKKIEPVVLKKLPNGHNLDVTNKDYLHQTGYCCCNCKRCFPCTEVKFTIDKKEMQRDVDNLLDYLFPPTESE